MQRAGFDIEGVALAHLIGINGGNEGVVLDASAEILDVQLVVEAADEVCARLTVDHVPELRLAPVVGDACGVFVIGMHLNRNVIHGVDQLDEQGKSVIFGTVGTEEIRAGSVKRREGRATRIDALFVLAAGEHKRLGGIFVWRVKTEVGTQLCAAPNKLPEGRTESDDVAVFHAENSPCSPKDAAATLSNS